MRHFCVIKTYSSAASPPGYDERFPRAGSRSPSAAGNSTTRTSRRSLCRVELNYGESKGGTRNAGGAFTAQLNYDP
jgi:hypothetical protein